MTAQIIDFRTRALARGLKIESADPSAPKKPPARKKPSPAQKPTQLVLDDHGSVDCTVHSYHTYYLVYEYLLVSSRAKGRGKTKWAKRSRELLALLQEFVTFEVSGIDAGKMLLGMPKPVYDESTDHASLLDMADVVREAFSTCAIPEFTLNED